MKPRPHVVQSITRAYLDAAKLHQPTTKEMVVCLSVLIQITAEASEVTTPEMVDLIKQVLVAAEPQIAGINRKN